MNDYKPCGLVALAKIDDLAELGLLTKQEADRAYARVNDWLREFSRRVLQPENIEAAREMVKECNK